jgi:hypothetical protein
MSTVIMLVIAAWITTLSMNLVYSVRECGKMLKISQQMAVLLNSSSAESVSSLEGAWDVRLQT